MYLYIWSCSIYVSFDTIRTFTETLDSFNNEDLYYFSISVCRSDVMSTILRQTLVWP